ncbi:MAG: ATP-binding cassette domain-containing protein, partial [Cyanobium sp.]
MAIVMARGLRKSFRVADKQPGFSGTMRHLLRRRWIDLEAVRELSFQIEAGEVVGFLGGNGAGKTTTLKLHSGLIPPSGGEHEVAGHRPFRRQRAFLEAITLVMAQKQQLIWDLPPLDSLRV